MAMNPYSWMGPPAAAAGGSLASLTEKICSVAPPTWRPQDVVGVGGHSAVGSVSLIGCIEAGVRSDTDDVIR